jgi:hypothetical protein
MPPIQTSQNPAQKLPSVLSPCTHAPPLSVLAVLEECAHITLAAGHAAPLSERSWSVHVLFGYPKKLTFSLVQCANVSAATAAHGLANLNAPCIPTANVSCACLSCVYGRLSLAKLFVSNSQWV